MSLVHLIRGLLEPDAFATATSATSATPPGDVGRSVASVATVAVASSLQGHASTGDTGLASRLWLLHYRDRDPSEVFFCSEENQDEILTSYPNAFAAVPVALAIRPPSEPLTVYEENDIRAWLELIEVTDLATISEVFEQCNRDAGAKAHFIERAATDSTEPDLFPDDRRTCRQCANLSLQGRCLAAWRGEIAASRSYEPITDLLQRCEGYVPEPGLIQNGEE